MKRLLFIFFVCLGFIAKAQVFTPMTAAGYQNKRTKTDSTNYIPTFPGFPTLRSTVAQKQAAIAADSTNKLFYWYDPKTETWNVLGSGSGSTINIFNDTTILICSGTNNCDTFITNVTANYVSIFNDSTLIVCNTSGACDTININPTTFGVSVVSFTKNATQDSIILTLSDNTRLAVKDSLGVGISTINIITDSSISICNFNSCDTFITTVNPQLVTILNDSTLLVCDTLNVCDTLHIPRTQFIQNLFDTTNIYNQIQNVYNYFSDTSFTNQFFPRGDGVLLDTVIRITDSTLRFIYTDGTQVEDTFRIALTQENITNITNIINYIDSLRGNDTTFILSASNLQSGLKALYSTTDSLSGNDTLHLEFPHNNISEDSVLTTDVDGDLKMKLVTAGSSGVNNTGAGYRLVTGDGILIKTVNRDLTLTIDSSSNANQLTWKVDTAQIATTYDNSLKLNSSDTTGQWVNYITKNAAHDSIIYFKGSTRFAVRDSISASSISGTAWLTTGNAGITPITNFLGTTNAQSLRMRTNNVERMNIDSVGNVGIWTNGYGTNSRLTLVYDNIVAGNTTYATDSMKGIALVNNIPATSGVTTQYTPFLRFRGSGWKSNATAASQPVDWRMFASGTTGATVAQSSFQIDGVVNGANWNATSLFLLSSTGNLTISGNVASGATVSGATGSFTTLLQTSKNVVTTSADGLLLNPQAGATSGVPVQYSPRIRMTSNAWDGTQNIFAGATMEVRGISGSSPVTSNLVMSFSNTTTAPFVGTDRVWFNSGGGVGLGRAPVASAVLDAGVNTTKGFLPPVVTTTQKNAISSPAEGLVVYDVTLHKLCVYTGAAWETVTSL